jgi:2-dehydropantoate 2-reductase
MTLRKSSNVLIVGAGALGSLFGARLAAAGESITFLQRGEEKVKTINEEGLRLRDGDKETAYQIPTYTKDDLPKEQGFDWVLIMTKAYDTEEAMTDASPWVGEDTMVLTLQNGIGPVDIITQAVGDERVAAGTTSEGALLHSPGIAEHTGRGETIVASSSKRKAGRVSELVEVLEHAGFKAQQVDDISPYLWGKALINAVINPITAILGIPNGEILESERAKKIAVEVAKECAEIIGAMGVKLPYRDPLEKAFEVARNTASNRSSMLQDVESGRRTEIEYISGAFVNKAQELGREAPINAVLRVLLLSKESARPSRP